MKPGQRRIGVVSQDTFLFNMSLADNIAFGSPGASREAIEAYNKYGKSMRDAGQSPKSRG